MEPVVTTRGLTRDYGGVGRFDTGLVVPAGCVYGLVGMNAGRTTLLSLLSGLRRPDRGSITITVPRTRLAVCPDVPEFDGWLTAREVVELAWPACWTGEPAASPAAWCSGSAWRARWSPTPIC